MSIVTVDILSKDATVQGSEAPTSIANGIHHLDRSEDVNLDDGSVDVYRKKQQWDAASFPDWLIPIDRNVVSPPYWAGPK